MATIFVAIAAFNERYLQQTVDSLLRNKSGKHEIIVSICDFRSDDEFPEFVLPEIIHYRHKSSIPTGVGVARSMALRNCEMFDYVLQVDAHMIFGSEWDSNLVDRHMELTKLEGVSVISQHVPACQDLGDGKLTEDTNPNHLQTPVRLFVNDQCKIWSEPWAKTESEWYKENTAVHAAFMFTTSEVLVTIPPDPLIFFFGEEHTTYMRMISRGIKSFSTDYCDITHLDKNQKFYDDMEKRDWRTFTYANYVAEINSFELFSNKRALSILSGKITGLWGAPDENSANEAIHIMNLNLKQFESIVKF